MQMLAVDLDETLINRCQESSSHPDSITYTVADVMTSDGRQSLTNYMQLHDIQRFDVVTCFSVTMWIHLHHGDAGMRDFLSYMSSLCERLLVEPQPWSCYRNAVRRMRKLDCETFPEFSRLTWRQHVHADIERFLLESCSMKLSNQYGVTDDWKRPMYLFTRDNVT